VPKTAWQCLAVVFGSTSCPFIPQRKLGIAQSRGILTREIGGIQSNPASRVKYTLKKLSCGYGAQARQRYGGQALHFSIRKAEKKNGGQARKRRINPQS